MTIWHQEAENMEMTIKRAITVWNLLIKNQVYMKLEREGDYQTELSVHVCTASKSRLVLMTINLKIEHH